MLKWRKPTFKEYIFVVIILVIVTGMLIPTCNFGHTKKVNEKMALSIVLNFFSNQVVQFKENGQFLSKEEVLSSDNTSQWGLYGYNAIYDTDKKSFKLWLVPKNYGKESNLSIYTDSLTGDVHGLDHQGGRSSNTDPVIQQVSAEIKKKLDIINSTDTK